MDKERKKSKLRNEKLAALNQSIISTLVNKTFTDIDYSGEYYIQSNLARNKAIISVPTCEMSDEYFLLDNTFEPMYYRIQVHTNVIASHLTLFDNVLKALVGYDISEDSYLWVAEACEDGILLEKDYSLYRRCLERAATKDVKLCFKWMISLQKTDNEILNCLLPKLEDYIRQGHSLEDVSDSVENLQKLGLDCIEPASKGEPKALYRLGHLYQQYDMVERAKEIFRGLIEKDEPLGYSGLSELLFNECQPISKQLQAIYYHTKAADNGDIEAMYRSGAILTKVTPSTGGYQEDWMKGVHYLELAACQNHIKACFLLGRIYYQGTYLPKDLNKAESFLSIAAMNGHGEASALMRIIKDNK